MYNAEGEKIWERQLDLNGKVISGDNDQCPFTFQGQYYDKEIDLCYNRFRYYDCNDGRYISKDPIGLASGEFGFYNYVEDSNAWVDVFGLAGIGGAYMFTFESGNAYIGKGQKERMNDSISTRTKQDITKGGNGNIMAQAHVETKYKGKHNNELGKMVEFKAMENAGFKGGRDVPENYMNAWRSGESAWNNKKNAHLRKRASELADELKRKHDADMSNRKKGNSYNKNK